MNRLDEGAMSALTRNGVRLATGANVITSRIESHPLRVLTLADVRETAGALIHHAPTQPEKLRQVNDVANISTKEVGGYAVESHGQIELPQPRDLRARQQQMRVHSILLGEIAVFDLSFSIFLS